MSIKSGKLTNKKAGEPDHAVVSVFLALVGVFIFILAQFFVSAVGELLQGLLFLLPFAIFFSLGLALVILTLKRKVEGKLKKFLLLTGGSAAGFFIGVVLHNFFYALGVVTEYIPLLHYLMEALHVSFFVAATLVCPVGFLIGAVGSAIILIRKSPRNP